eukprot:gene15086-20299_t
MIFIQIIILALFTQSFDALIVKAGVRIDQRSFISDINRIERCRTKLWESSSPKTDILFKKHDTINLLLKSTLDPFRIVWEFSRPHTIVGSAISIVCLFLFATPSNMWLTHRFLTGLKEAIIPSLLMNLYITGLNQVTDIEIDKVNKPYLPIAKGELSFWKASAIVALSGIASLLSVRFSAWPLQAAVVGSGLLGTVYSLPPFRLKRFPLLAAFCILVVRGSLVNMGFFLQAKSTFMNIPKVSLNSLLEMYPESVIVTAFFAIFGLVIALMKDVPDIKGDILFKIRSFSVILGAPKMFRMAWNILYGLLLSASLTFGCSVAAHFLNVSKSLTSIVLATRLLISLVLGYFAYDVQSRAVETNSQEPKAVFDYYMHIWKLFYGCYLILPFVR